VTWTVLADTGPLYAALDPDDQYHRRAQAEMAVLARAGSSVAVLWPTILEADSLALYRLGVPGRAPLARRGDAWCAGGRSDPR